jgi:hypothetical protein
LQHKSIVGFVSHCGLSSLAEAMDSNVPVICMAMGADQFVVRTRLKELNYPIPSIEGWHSKKEIRIRLKKLLDPSTNKKAKTILSEIWKTMNVVVGGNGAQRGADIIDLYVTTNPRYTTWSPDHDLNFLEKTNADIILAVLLVLYLIYKLLKILVCQILCCGLCCKKKKRKEKTN